MKIVNATEKSEAAFFIKLVDKNSNVAVIGSSPPADWGAEWKGDYFVWARPVVAYLP